MLLYKKMSIRVDYVDYTDEIAPLFSAKPILWKLFFTDLTFFWALVFGPSLLYQYRLEGPNGARHAILTVYDRIRYPPYGNEYKCKNMLNPDSSVFHKYILVCLLITFWLLRREASINYYFLAWVLPAIITWKVFYKK